MAGKARQQEGDAPAPVARTIKKQRGTNTSDQPDGASSFSLGSQTMANTYVLGESSQWNVKSVNL